MAETKSKKKSKSKKKNREMLVFTRTPSMKGKIVLVISEMAKEREYFTNADIFFTLIRTIQIDLKDMKKVKSLYNYVIRITNVLEEEGYLKGYHVPGSRYVHWKLVKPLPLQNN